jgi:hypothetical protein
MHNAGKAAIKQTYKGQHTTDTDREHGNAAARYAITIHTCSKALRN